MPNDTTKSEKSSSKDADVSKLSKKERRKLKVEEKKSVTETVAAPVIQQQKKDVEKVQEDTPKPLQEKVFENNVSADGKSKAQLRAERREMQEKQRQHKQAAKETKPPAATIKLDTPIKASKKENIQPVAIKSPKKPIMEDDPIKKQTQRVQLFSHLGRTTGYRPEIINKSIHPAFIRLGAQYADKTVIGSNARCLALLNALKHFIVDFRTPVNQELCRAFETHLTANIDHLQKCRPFAVSMTNALRNFKLNLSHIPTALPDSEKKHQMQEIVDAYVEDEMDKAAAAISIKVCEKISDEDVILTYGHSSLVNKILIDAKQSGKQFKVIVVDGRPLLEGRRTLNKLVNAGIECTYILITATSFIIKQATKVIVGAHALLNNGYVMARAGTAMVALIARMHMKPVLVCCETFKFSERAQTDSFVYNEIGDPNDVMEIKNKTSGYLNALNLMYDVTPPKYVTGVATELGILPCTSVPVILRFKPTE